MYALVEIKGKQYKAEKDSVLKIDKIENSIGDEVNFDSVLMTRDGDKLEFGAPFLKGMAVKATVEDHIKDKKVMVFKKKKRKGYRKKQGHRQQYSLVRVEDIVKS